MSIGLKDKALLEDVIFYIEKIEKFYDLDIDAEVKVFSIRMCLAQIGECIRKISLEIKNDYPEIQWQEIIATRNIIIHNYSGFDEEIEETIVSEDIPELKINILKIINNLGQEYGDK